MHPSGGPLLCTSHGVSPLEDMLQHQPGKWWQSTQLLATVPSSISYHPALLTKYFGFCVPWTCHLPMNQCLCMCYFLFLECSPHFFLWLNSVSPSSLSVKHHSFREVAQRDNISPTQLQLSLGQDSLVCPPTNPTFVLLNLSCTWKVVSVRFCLMSMSLALL